MNRTVILCGLGRVGFRILDQLRRSNWDVRVISIKESDDPRLQGVTYIRGDCRRPDLLEHAGLKDAAGVVIVTSEDGVNVQTALLVRQLNPTVRIVVRTFNQNLLPRLGALVKNTVALSVSALTAPMIALTALTGETLGVFKIAEQQQQISELQIVSNSALLARRIADVASRHRLLVLAHGRSNTEPELWTRVSGDTILREGDTLVVCGSPADVGPLVDGGNEHDHSVRWAGWIRRQLRSAGRAIAALDWQVRFASLALIGTLFISTLIFRYGIGSSWADGIYHTVSIVATGGELRRENAEPWVKVFVSVLKIAGAALLAVFTAIFTQYFIRSKLGGVLEARRIPDAGHVVVCGLGNVGFRCVEELIRLGQRVVAIETVNDNPFNETVRRLGAPVVIGSATIPAVLHQARVATARAVIAATDDELVNLEIALLVREVNAEQRVVVRLTEPNFAEAVRDAANIRLAVSVPALAAPAFAAALYGDRVQTLLTVGHETLAVVELIVQDGDDCLGGQSLHASMIDYRFLPLGLSSRPTFAAEGLPKQLQLRPGDRLTIVTAIENLEPLLRREKPIANQRVLVSSFPLSAKDGLVAILRTRRSCSQADAEAILATAPFVLADGLTLGEAEELLARMLREKVLASRSE